MEYATGGDLYTRRPYTEIQSIRIIKKLLSAVAYMHNHNIMHRDCTYLFHPILKQTLIFITVFDDFFFLCCTSGVVKFENIMFENKKTSAEIKVIDFGLSTKFLNPFYVMRDKVGTLCVRYS